VDVGSVANAGWQRVRITTTNFSKSHETRDSLSSSYLQVVLIYLYPL